MIDPGQMNTRIHVYESFDDNRRPPSKRICSLWAMMKAVSNAKEDLGVAAVTSSFMVDFLVWNNLDSRRVRPTHVIDAGYANFKYNINVVTPDATDAAYLHIICTEVASETNRERM